MEQTKQFTLETHRGPYEKWPSVSRLFVNGEDTKKSITGYLIEGQYTCADGYLLVTSMDCAFEETSHFILLDRDFNTIATNHLGVMYDTFLINSHWPISESAIRIHYYGDFFYTMSIERSAAWARGKQRLVLTPFKQFASDPQCVQSINSLQERLRKTAASMALTGKQIGQG